MNLFKQNSNSLNLGAKLFIAVSALTFSHGAELARGVNDVLNIELDARKAALGGINGPLSYRTQFNQGSEAQMVDAQEMSLRISHLAWIAGSQYDGLSFTLPLIQNTNALSFAVLRFAQDGIPLVDENEIVEGNNFRTFSLSEYVFQGSYAHSWDYIKLGGTLHLLYRDIGQTGLGVRGDAHALFNVSDFVFSLRAEALTTSAASWESDHFEYEEPEVFIGMGYTQAVPYFYGSLEFLWESVGIFREEAHRRTGDDEGDDRLFVDPLGALSVSKVAVEYSGSHGISLRVGLPVIREFKWPSFGAGYDYKGIAGLDYSINKHPELGVFHRVNLSVSEKLIKLLK